jgi:hypothetical protein
MKPKDKNPPAGLKVPWITRDGSLDLRKFPIDSVLKQSLAENEEEFRSSCSLLGSMHAHGRHEAGIYLLGLLRYWQDDLNRLAVVVEKLCYCHTPAAADALFSELKRVPGSNTTRGYLNTVLKALKSFPVELVADGLEAFAEDRSFSYRWRAKFREAVGDMVRKHSYRDDQPW